MATSKITVDKRGVNPNLLDNWYFVGGGSQQGGGQFPINQNGQTSYSGAVYGINRWIPTNGGAAITVRADCIEIGGSNGGYLAQYLEWDKLKGKTVTYSVLFSDNGVGKLASGTGAMPASVPSAGTTVINFNAQIPHGGGDGLYVQSSGKAYVQIGVLTGYSLRVLAAKLELGDTQTLAHLENGVWVLNEVPDYEEELLKCQTSVADAADGKAGHSLVRGRLAASGKPYFNFVGSDGNIYQFVIDGNTRYLRVEYYNGSNWTVIANYAPVN